MENALVGQISRPPNQYIFAKPNGIHLNQVSESGERGAGLLQRIALSMPARLAVGLGCESSLGKRDREPFAPSPLLGSLGLPHPATGQGLGCNGVI